MICWMFDSVQNFKRLAAVLADNKKMHSLGSPESPAQDKINCNTTERYVYFIYSYLSWRSIVYKVAVSDILKITTVLSQTCIKQALNSCSFIVMGFHNLSVEKVTVVP